MDSAGPFFEQFIDDYFAECEEHLVTIRRALLQLESDGKIGESDADGLKRALHTVKGLSGMVGLAPVERIAHAMEDAVGQITVGASAPGRIVELLFTGVRLLEERIQARRRGEPVLEAQSFVDDVAAAVGPVANRHEPGAAPTPQGPATRIKVAFTPSHQLADRGVTIDAIRSRLTERADIESAMPRVHPGGGVYFEFVAQLKPGRTLDEAWREDGLSWTELADERGTLVHVGPEDVSRPVPPRAASTANLVRVDLARLDETMRIVGELVISRSRLQDAVDRLAARVGDAAIEPIAAAADSIERQLRALREGIMRIRLVQIGEVFERMRFAMREIAREHGKAIHLEFAGGDTELDKVVIDRIVEPLMHLVRNAASHGIETPEMRANAGKPATGQIMLRAHAAGDRIFVEVEDDGAGIDIDRVEQRAHERGLLPARSSLEPSAVLDVLASPGFSTAASTDMASGRGVGMAVVVSTIRGLGGELTVESRSGSGTRFVIELPLTLMIADALLVKVGGQTLAVPQILLREVLDLADHAVTPLENNKVITYRESVLPLIDVREIFSVMAPAPAKHVLVVGADGGLQGLMVDRVLGLREIVVQPVSDPYVNVVGVAGATELPDGSVSLILDVPAIVRHHRRRGGAQRSIAAPRRDAIGSGS